MSLMFQNAVGSIRIGIEDYNSTDSDRVFAAVRSYYSGILLLAKESLCRQVANADPDLLLAAKYSAEPDGAGGMKIKPSNETIDFSEIQTV